jgi:hypothetical protein
MNCVDCPYYWQNINCLGYATCMGTPEKHNGPRCQWTWDQWLGIDYQI